MGQRNTTDIINRLAEFLVVSFVIFSAAELAKPRLITAFLRLDFYFAIMVAVVILSLLYNSLSDR